MIRFLHGIGGRPDHFVPLAAALGAEADLAASPALPGHGQDPYDRPAVRVPGDDTAAGPGTPPGTDPVLAAARNWAGRSGTHPDLLIGHSTGGAVALRAVAEGLVRPAALVVIDSNVPVSPDALAARAAKASLADRPDWRTLLRASLEKDLVAPDDWRRRILADLDATPDHPMRELWGAVLAADTRALWAGLPVPALYVRSTRDVRPADLAAVTTRATVVDVGPGHWPHVAAPDDVAEAILCWRYTLPLVL